MRNPDENLHEPASCSETFRCYRPAVKGRSTNTETRRDEIRSRFLRALSSRATCGDRLCKPCTWATQSTAHLVAPLPSLRCWFDPFRPNWQNRHTRASFIGTRRRPTDDRIDRRVAYTRRVGAAGVWRCVAQQRYAMGSFGKRSTQLLESRSSKPTKYPKLGRCCSSGSGMRLATSLMVLSA